MYCLWNKLTHYKHTPFLSLMIRHFQSRLQEQIYAQATCSLYVVSSWLPPATKLGQGNIFRSVCQQFCPQGGRAWLLGEACMVTPGGMHGFIQGHVWFYSGGACVVFSVFSDTMRYGQWAGGTHPTGMHSGLEYLSGYCLELIWVLTWQ